MSQSDQQQELPQTALGYSYFISFVYTTEDEPSKERTDNMALSSRQQVSGMKQVEEMQSYILKSNKPKGWRSVKIIGFQFLDCIIADYSAE